MCGMLDDSFIMSNKTCHLIHWYQSQSQASCASKVVLVIVSSSTLPLNYIFCRSQDFIVRNQLQRGALLNLSNCPRGHCRSCQCRLIDSRSAVQARNATCTFNYVSCQAALLSSCYQSSNGKLKCCCTLHCSTESQT